eukprot:3679134-Karenia_brevis.AAC.1
MWTRQSQLHHKYDTARIESLAFDETLLLDARSGQPRRKQVRRRTDMEPVGAVHDCHYGLASEFVVGEDNTTVYWKVIMEDNTLEDVWVPEDCLEVCSHDYRPRASEGACWIWLMMSSSGKRDII